MAVIQGRKPDGTPTTYEEFDNLEPLNELRQQERMDIIASELVSCKSKKAIIAEYAQLWKCKPATIKRLIDETIVWMAQSAKLSANEYRVLNSERLESMFDETQRVSDKIKIVDMLNRTNNVYDTNVKVTTNEPITIDLGV